MRRTVASVILCPGKQLRRGAAGGAVPSAPRLPPRHPGAARTLTRTQKPLPRVTVPYNLRASGDIPTPAAVLSSSSPETPPQPCSAHPCVSVLTAPQPQGETAPRVLRCQARPGHNSHHTRRPFPYRRPHPSPPLSFSMTLGTSLLLSASLPSTLSAQEQSAGRWLTARAPTQAEDRAWLGTRPPSPRTPTGCPSGPRRLHLQRKTLARGHS